MGGPALVRHIDRLEADGIVARSRDTRRPPDDPPQPHAGRPRAGSRRSAAVIARCDAELRAVITDDEASVVMQRSLDKLFAFARTEL